MGTETLPIGVSIVRSSWYRMWIPAGALVVAVLLGLVSAQPAFAQSNCTGGRSQSVDRNGNGTIDAGETFTLDLCRQVTFSIGGGTKTVRVHYTTSNGVATDRLTTRTPNPVSGSAERSRGSASDESTAGAAGRSTVNVTS